MNAPVTIKNCVNRLDSFSPWAFTGSMYAIRWAMILPIGYALGTLGVSGGKAVFEGSPFVLLFGFIFLAPAMETLLECAMPYWLLSRAGRIRKDKRPWLFVVVSATLMTLLHISAWPSAIIPSLITGSFLAYTYGHFVPVGLGQAWLHTWVFHAGINIVGWSLLMAARASV